MTRKLAAIRTIEEIKPIECADAIGEEVLLACAGGHDKVVQGFTDQFGFCLTRKEAYIIARDAGQLLPRHVWGEVLYSESYI